MAKKILIIEDDANVLYALQAKFSLAGFQITAVDGGSLPEIIHKIEMGRPDYIILDLILPDLHGHEILGAIKAHEGISHIPVFVFTDLSDKDTKVRSLDLGADYHFLKQDFLIDDFVEKVKKIISNSDKMKEKNEKT